MVILLKVLQKNLQNPSSNTAIGGIYLFKNQKILLNMLSYFYENSITSKGEYQLTDAMQKMLEDGYQFKITFYRKNI